MSCCIFFLFDRLLWLKQRSCCQNGKVSQYFGWRGCLRWSTKNTMKIILLFIIMRYLLSQWWHIFNYIEAKKCIIKVVNAVVLCCTERIEFICQICTFSQIHFINWEIATVIIFIRLHQDLFFFPLLFL